MRVRLRAALPIAALVSAAVTVPVVAMAADSPATPLESLNESALAALDAGIDGMNLTQSLTVTSPGAAHSHYNATMTLGARRTSQAGSAGAVDEGIDRGKRFSTKFGLTSQGLVWTTWNREGFAPSTASAALRRLGRSGATVQTAPVDRARSSWSAVWSAADPTGILRDARDASPGAAVMAWTDPESAVTLGEVTETAVNSSTRRFDADLTSTAAGFSGHATFTATDGRLVTADVTQTDGDGTRRVVSRVNGFGASVAVPGPGGATAVDHFNYVATAKRIGAEQVTRPAAAKIAKRANETAKAAKVKVTIERIRAAGKRHGTTVTVAKAKRGVRVTNRPGTASVRVSMCVKLVKGRARVGSC